MIESPTNHRVETKVAARDLMLRRQAIAHQGGIRRGMSKTPRRAVVPASAPFVTDKEDPIFTAIERQRAAMAAFSDAVDSLAVVQPTTFAGLTALVQDNALEWAEKLIRVANALEDEDLKGRARQIRDRLVLPMSKVLEKVPGDTVVKKVESIGISRQAYYAWLDGRARPNATQALQLAKLTGFDPVVIRGRKLSSTPAAVRTRATRAARRVKQNRYNLAA